jgi:hypothetical protein
MEHQSNHVLAHQQNLKLNLSEFCAAAPRNAATVPSPVRATHRQKKSRGRFEDHNSIYAKTGQGAQPPSVEECPQRNEWANDDPNYCLQASGKGIVGMSKPKRNRFSDVHSIHGTRKNRERWGENAMHEVGLSAEEVLKVTKGNKGGGYVPSNTAPKSIPKDPVIVCQVNSVPHVNIFQFSDASRTKTMYDEVFQSLGFKVAQAPACTRSTCDKDSENEDDEVKPLGLFAKQSRSKHGRFSSVGCIYKQ